MNETANSFVINVVVVATAGDEDDVSRHRQPNRQRQKGSRGRICWKTTSSIIQFSPKSTSDEEQKMTVVIQLLAYSSCADQCAELTRMGESTTLECMKK
ncbi:hypothetical protein QQ045_002348 [Rhodiola kirilowii]